VAPASIVSVIVVTGVLLLMLVELQLSAFNERGLRARGAVEPPDDPYPLMRLAYPAAFVAMGVESAIGGSLPREWVLAGLILLGFAKLLKFWVMATLGDRWTFRVLVPRDATMVTTGPYRFLNHPNYVAVIGELAAVAIALRAPMAGVVSVLLFVWILRRRIAVEDRMLGRG
jgi:methyltransferase